jgi:hypothetical protein
LVILCSVNIDRSLDDARRERWRELCPRILPRLPFFAPVGEYFLSEEQKRARAAAAQEAKQAKRVEERAKQRQAAFVAPKVG